MFYVKRVPPLPAVFSNAPKGRKGEKEMGIQNSRLGPKVQRRENVGGSLVPLDPKTSIFTLGQRLLPL